VLSRRTRADGPPLDRPPFSFTTTRDAGLRFSNGHFTMIGLRVNDKPLLRAYSIVSPTTRSTWSS
jgi:ferredoxin-NADP reductase